MATKGNLVHGKILAKKCSYLKSWEFTEHYTGQLGAYFSHMRVLDR